MRKRLLCALLAVCLLATCLCGCKKKQKDDGKGGGFRFPIAAEPAMLDPQMAQDDASVTVLCALFEGLTRLDEKGKIVPAAATWTVSEDGLTYTFTLFDNYWCTPADTEESREERILRGTTGNCVLFCSIFSSN